MPEDISKLYTSDDPSVEESMREFLSRATQALDSGGQKALDAFLNEWFGSSPEAEEQDG